MNKLEISFGSPLRIVVAHETPQLGHACLTITDRQCSFTAKGDVMYTLPVGYGVELQVEYVDAGGNVATIDGAVTWSSSDEEIVKVATDSTDTKRCGMTSGTKIGQAQVTATADADLGEGVRNLVTLLDVTVIAGEAVAGTITPVSVAAPIEVQPIKKK
jgi:hypothetical protein